MGRLSFQEEGVKNYNGGFCLSGVSLIRPRRSFHKSPSSSALVTSRKSFSYAKLAQVPILLTVIKLDGSSFEINVMKSATIADLKQAVERIFSHLSANGLDEISWRHVWGHFCLSFCGIKLLNDGENIKDYGIKDGDELRFMRHVSIAYNLIKKPSRNPLDVLKPCTIPETSDEERRELEENKDEDDESIKTQEYKYQTVMSGSVETVQCEQPAIRRKQQLNRSRGGFIGYFRGLFHFCSKRCPVHSSKVSQVEI